MFNESNHKLEVVPREEHVLLAHPPQLLHPRPLATHQLQPPATKATNQSICLKQPRRPAELVGELQAPVEDALEEQAVLTLQDWVPVLVQQPEQKAVLAVWATSISYVITPSSSSSVRLCRLNHICWSPFYSRLGQETLSLRNLLERTRINFCSY